MSGEVDRNLPEERLVAPSTRMEMSCWKTEELSWRAETVSSALVVSEMLVESQNRHA